MQLKKVTNEGKYTRVRNNPRSNWVRVYYQKDGIRTTFGVKLDDHVYLVKEEGVFPHQRFQYYVYYINLVGGVAVRADYLAFYDITNPLKYKE